MGAGQSWALVARGVVAADYLADWDDGQLPAGREEEPVVYVSAYAAEAFAVWVSGQLPAAPDRRRWVARLPFEPEWELRRPRRPGGSVATQRLRTA